jgi:hypothetical protein
MVNYEPDEELVEWVEPRSCRAWRGQMKRIELGAMEVISEEAEDAVSGEEGELRISLTKKGQQVGERGRKKKRQRQKLCGYIRVYRDDRRSSRGRAASREEVESNAEGKRRAEMVMEEVEGNQRKRRKRNRAPRPSTPASPPTLPPSCSFSADIVSQSSPEPARRRKSFFELEEEALALESHLDENDLVWIEETPERSTFDDDDDDDEGDEEAGDGLE